MSSENIGQIDPDGFWEPERLGNDYWARLRDEVNQRQFEEIVEPLTLWGRLRARFTSRGD